MAKKEAKSADATRTVFCTREELEETRKKLLEEGFVVFSEVEEGGRIEVIAKNINAESVDEGKQFVD